MTPRFIRLLASAIVFCATPLVQAAITCTAPVAGAIATAYSGAAGTLANVTQGSVSFSCTRNLAGDPTDLLLRADNGANAGGGGQNRVRRGALANRLNYEAYQDSACTTLWTGNNNATSIPFTLQPAPAVPLGVAQPVTLNFWVCLPAGQAAVATGVTPYTDTVGMFIRNTGGGTVYNTGNFNITVTAIGTCSITGLPADINISYTAFNAVATASTGFTLDCTSQLPYEMTLDAYDVVLGNGIHYSININAATPPVKARGTGPGQNHTINVTVPGNQAGTCATGICTNSHTHTLTITY